MSLRWAALGAWTVGLGACVVFAWLFGLPELAALAIAAAVALCLSAGWLALNTTPEVTAVVEPSTCNQGDPATLRLRFSAAAGSRTSPARLWGRLGTAGDGIVAVSALDPAQSTTVGVSLPTPLRGLVRIGPLSLRTNDPLRLFHRDHPLDCAASLLVRPEIHQLPGTAEGGGRMIAPGRRTGGGSTPMESDSELIGLRPYVRGDDVRRIHWRTSARLGEPHVVQVEPPVRSPGTTVLLDQRPDSTADGFERAVSAAASVLVAAAEAGRSVRLVTRNTDGTVLDSGSLPPSQIGSLLDTLATVARLTSPAVEPADAGGTDEDTVVWCTATTATTFDPPRGVNTVVTCDAQAVPRIGADVQHVSWSGDASLGDAWMLGTAASEPAQ